MMPNLLSLVAPVASLSKEVNPWLAKRPLKTNGRLANRAFNCLSKRGHWRLSLWQSAVPSVTTKLASWQLSDFSVSVRTINFAAVVCGTRFLFLLPWRSSAACPVLWVAEVRTGFIILSRRKFGLVETTVILFLRRESLFRIQVPRESALIPNGTKTRIVVMFWVIFAERVFFLLVIISVFVKLAFLTIVLLWWSIHFRFVPAVIVTMVTGVLVIWMEEMSLTVEEVSIVFIRPRSLVLIYVFRGQPVLATLFAGDVAVFVVLVWISIILFSFTYNSVKGSLVGFTSSWYPA